MQRLKRDFPDFDFDLVLWSEVEMNAIAAHNSLFPKWKDRNWGSMTDIDWNKAPDIDMLFYSTPCFVAGTLILTKEGYKPIENVKVGDYVLTHNNRWCQVEKTGSKLSADMYHVNPMMGDHVYCTGEHPFLTREMYRYGHKRSRYFREPQWTAAKDLTKQTYLGYAINTESKLPEWNGSIDNQWGKHRHVNHLLPLLTNGAFWYLMGRYVGDGWKRIGKNGNSIIICCSNRNEDTLIKAFEACHFHYRKMVERTVYKYIVSMNELASFVERYGYYAYGKHIDADTLNLPVEYLRKFIKGYVDSDGCYTNNEWKITSVSKELLTGMVQCIAKAYHTHARMTYFKRPETCVIEGRTVRQRDTYTISWHIEHRKQDKAFYENGYIWFPISKPIEKVDEIRTVYNLQVSGDHSYTANGAIVHNCQDISNAGKQRGLTKGSGTRSSLIWSVEEAIKVKKIKYLCLENVRALISRRFLPDFLRWLGILESYGYTNYWQIMNSADYGVPQHRERVFCISILNDGDGQSFKFPKPFPLTKTLGDVLEEKVDDKFYLTDKALAYFKRVNDDKSHNHNFTPKKNETSPSQSDARQEAESTTTTTSNGMDNG